jgi:hypothetical protein
MFATLTHRPQLSFNNSIINATVFDYVYEGGLVQGEFTSDTSGEASLVIDTCSFITEGRRFITHLHVEMHFYSVNS